MPLFRSHRWGGGAVSPAPGIAWAEAAQRPGRTLFESCKPPRTKGYSDLKRWRGRRQLGGKAGTRGGAEEACPHEWGRPRGHPGLKGYATALRRRINELRMGFRRERILGIGKGGGGGPAVNSRPAPGRRPARVRTPYRAAKGARCPVH